MKGIKSSLIISVISSTITTLVLFSTGFFFNEFSINQGMLFAKTGNLIILSLLLLVVAGLILSKKNEKPAKNKIAWEKRFGNLNVTFVIILIALMFLLYAVGIDYVLFY